MLELFGEKSIQSMIDFKWPLIKGKITRVLYCPYAIYLLTTVSYTSWVLFENEFVPDAIEIIFRLVLFGFSLYFMSIEFMQMNNQGISYFKSPWNLIDIVPPTCQTTLILS